jgi:hypothetical protein
MSVVHRVEAADEATSSTGSVPVAPPAGGATATSADATPTNPAQLDQLAGALYDRIRSRLRADLIVERERAGCAADFY